jgi:hypothetical protein
MQIAESEEQAENADSPSAETRESGSKVRTKRLSHSAKQHREILRIDEGTQTD